MAVTRIKAQHGFTAMNNALNYSENEQKTDLSQYQDRLNNNDPMLLDANTINAFDYSANPDKTTYKGDIGTTETLVSGYMCDPYTAAKEFQLTMTNYYEHHDEHLGLQTAKRIFRAKLDKEGKAILDENGDMIYDEKSPVWKDPETGTCRYEEYKKAVQPRTSYMWVQSFPPESVCGYKIDPRLCHQIGMEFIKEVGGGQYQATVSTHMDKAHPHNHIMMCAYSMDGTHKYRDTLDTLKQARCISDDLSVKFGLPIIQSISDEIGKPVSWKEWKSKQEGQSWKEQMKQDIATAKKSTKNYSDFISQLENSGYKLRETENHITYTMPGAEEYKCRDSALGKSFEKTSIIEYYKIPEKQEEKEREKEEGTNPEFDNTVFDRLNSIHIHVSRYTTQGRRRSDLEMVFLTAIKILQAVKDLLQDKEAGREQPYNPIHRDYNWKMRQMVDSLKMTQELGIKDIGALIKVIDDTGKKLSIAKAESKELQAQENFNKEIGELIADVQESKIIADSIGFNSDSLYLHKTEKSEIQKKIAEKNPATPAQRRNLYILLQNSNSLYKLGCAYDSMSAKDAEAVISFLQKKSEIKPDILLMGDSKEIKELENKYEKVITTRLKHEKEKYCEPITDFQKKRVNDILSDNAYGIDENKLQKLEGTAIDVDKLTKYDAMQIINYFTGKNVILSPKADVMTIDSTKMILEKNNIVIHRPINEITLAEAKEIKDYFNYPEYKRQSIMKPDILEEYKQASDSNLAQLSEILKLKGKEVDIPIDNLSATEVFKLTSYLLKLDRVPDCIRKEVDQELDGKRNMLFEDTLLDFNKEERDEIEHYREVAQELMDYGIEPNDYRKEKENVQDSLLRLKQSVNDIESLKAEYTNLQRLKYNHDLAVNPKFSFGGKYDKDKQNIDINKIEEEQERTAGQKKEDEQIEKQEKQERHSVNSMKAFAFSDRYFDNTHRTL